MLKADGPTKQLQEIFAENDLYQLVSSPTRITQGSETIIDLFITNEPTRYIEVGCRNCCLSDHQLIYGIRKEETDNKMTNNEERQYRAYSKCSSELLQKDLHWVPWHILDIFDDIEDRWNMWKLLFNSILDEHAPLRKSRKKKNQVPWFTDEVRELVKERNHLWKKARRTKDENVWVEFRMVRNYVTAELRRSKRAYFEGVVWQSRRQPKKLWTEMNKNTRATCRNTSTTSTDRRGRPN